MSWPPPPPPPPPGGQNSAPASSYYPQQASRREGEASQAPVSSSFPPPPPAMTNHAPPPTPVPTQSFASMNIEARVDNHGPPPPPGNYFPSARHGLQQQQAPHPPPFPGNRQTPPPAAARTTLSPPPPRPSPPPPPPMNNRMNVHAPGNMPPPPVGQSGRVAPLPMTNNGGHGMKSAAGTVPPPPLGQPVAPPPPPMNNGHGNKRVNAHAAGNMPPVGQHESVAPPPVINGGHGMPSNTRPPPPTPVGQGVPPPPMNGGYGMPPPQAGVAPMNAQPQGARPPPHMMNGGHMPRPPPPPDGGVAGGMPDESRVDISAIPLPPLFTRPQEDNIPIFFTASILQSDNDVVVPPDADSRFVQNDTGIAVPQLMRSTTYNFPRDRGTASKSLGENLAVICTPLGLPSQDYMPRPRVLPDGSEEDWQDAVQSIPVIMSNEPPPRCPHCAAYVNPFWQRSGICNFCNTKTNYNVDQLDRRMIGYGTVEYQVGGPYVTRPTPVQPIFLYALDATCPRLPSYVEMLKELGESMATHCQRQSQPVKMRIGVCLVASFGVVIVNFDASQKLNLTVMPDVKEDPFSPLPLDEWTYDVSTSDGLNQWQSLTSRLWHEWRPFLQQLSRDSGQGLNHKHSCGGAALAVLADALQDTGGRATWLTWRRPNFGVGAIPNREDSKAPKYTEESTERELYTPLQLQAKSTTAGDFYKQLGEKCAKSRICIDVIYHTLPDPGAVFLDTATMGELCRISCGRLKWIRAKQWKEELLEELRRPALSFFGTDAVFKIRCSAGMEVKSYMPGTSPGVSIERPMADSPEQEMAVVDLSSTITVMFKHRVGGVPQRSRVVYVQFALLYTTASGQRRVRVSTLCLPVTSSPSQVIGSVDYSAYASLLTRQAVHNVWKPQNYKDRPLHNARDHLRTACVDFLKNYRLYTSARSAPAGQLIMPERFPFALFIMSLLKSPLLRTSLPRAGSGIRSVKPSPSADERAYSHFYGSSVLPQTSMLQVHANVLSISSLEEGDGEWQVPQISMAWSDLDRAAHPAYIQIPPTIHPSITCLEDDGMYLIDDGFTIFLYLGKDVTKEVWGKLLERNQDGFFVSKTTECGKRVRRLVWQMKTYCTIGGGCESSPRATVAPIEVVMGDENHMNPVEERVMTLMVDDGTSNDPDYMGFLKFLHGRVGQALANA